MFLGKVRDLISQNRPTPTPAPTSPQRPRIIYRPSYVPTRTVTQAQPTIVHHHHHIQQEVQYVQTNIPTVRNLSRSNVNTNNIQPAQNPPSISNVRTYNIQNNYYSSSEEDDEEEEEEEDEEEEPSMNDDESIFS